MWSACVCGRIIRNNWKIRIVYFLLKTIKGKRTEKKSFATVLSRKMYRQDELRDAALNA